MVAKLLLLFVLSASLVCGNQPTAHTDDTTKMKEAVKAVLQLPTTEHFFVVLICEQYSLMGIPDKLRASNGVVMFVVGETAHNVSDANILLPSIVDQTKKLQKTWRDGLVLMVSDNPKFLASFARISLKERLYSWSLRLLILTRLSLHYLGSVHKFLATANSALVILSDSKSIMRMSAYVAFPFREENNEFILTASWRGRHGFTPSSLEIFPEKYERFSTKPTLTVTAEEFPFMSAVMEEDPETPGRKQLRFEGYMADLLEYLSQSLNFSYRFLRPPDGTWGGKLENGTWTGMVGQVHEEVADIGLGPFGVGLVRAEAVDFTWPFKIIPTKMLAGRGIPEVNPWSFLLPLRPLVWAAALATLFTAPTLKVVLSYLLGEGFSWREFFEEHSKFSMSFLQEPITVRVDKQWWERMILGLWMLMTLVLTRSYEGNLMSLLAVRYVPQPFQMLRDVLDDPYITLAVGRGSYTMQSIFTAESGILKEVKEMEGGRLNYFKMRDIQKILDTEIRSGRQVLLHAEDFIVILNGLYYSREGRCDFYTSKGSLLPVPLAIIGRKEHPLVGVLSKRIMNLNEAGLYDQWFLWRVHNSTSCMSVRSTVTVSTSFSLKHSWSMFVVLAGGHIVGLFVFCGETLCNKIFQRQAQG